MANYTIGDMIYEARVARGYSQEELGYGLCSTSSLSRIENGSQVPSKKLFDALLQRLGISDSIYSAFISKEEMELYRLIQELVWRLERLNFEGIDSLIEELEKRIGDKDELDKQYILFAKANVLKRRGGEKEVVLSMLTEAIKMTMYDYKENATLKNRLLTFNEITILNGIALEYYSMDKKEFSLRLLYDLKEYLEQHVIDEEEKAKKYPMIVYNITKIIGEFGRYGEAYKLCDEAIDFSVKHNKLAVLPYLITNQACAAAELNNISEAESLFKQAIAIFNVCKKQRELENIREEAAVRYGVKIV